MKFNQKIELRIKERCLKAPFNVFTKSGLTATVKKERILSKTESVVYEMIRQHAFRGSNRTMCDIAKALNVSNTTVLRSVRNLVNAGFLERV